MSKLDEDITTLESWNSSSESQLQQPMTKWTIDAAVEEAARIGWHVKRIDGYDPLVGGPPSYRWTFTSPDGISEVSGEGFPLRLACLKAFKRVLDQL